MKESEIRPQELFDRYLALARRDVEVMLARRDGFAPVPCPACGLDVPAPAFVKEGFTYVLCRECGSLYASPRPTPEMLGSFYRDGESVKFWSTDFFKKTAEARREKMFRPRARLVAELLDRNPARDGLVFADIGSGYGIFLEEVRALGRFTSVLGIEPGPDLATVCRGLGFTVIQKPVEDVSPAECLADVATAFEVLEHVHDPLPFLIACRRLLRSDGTLLFTTLTVSGFDIQTLWERSNAVHPPHHLNLLSVEGLERLVARAGLRLLELSTPGQLDVDIVANALKADPALALPRFVRTLLARDEATRREFQELLARRRMSSHVRVVASPEKVI
jgi:SAM-dependent methyltransferase